MIYSSPITYAAHYTPRKPEMQDPLDSVSQFFHLSSGENFAFYKRQLRKETHIREQNRARCFLFPPALHVLKGFFYASAVSGA